jgi:hypothetical protein
MRSGETSLLDFALLHFFRPCIALTLAARWCLLPSQALAGLQTGILHSRLLIGISDA